MGPGALARADEGRTDAPNPILTRQNDAIARQIRKANAAMPKGRNFH